MLMLILLPAFASSLHINNTDGFIYFNPDVDKQIKIPCVDTGNTGMGSPTSVEWIKNHNSDQSVNVAVFNNRCNIVTNTVGATNPSCSEDLKSFTIDISTDSLTNYDTWKCKLYKGGSSVESNEIVVLSVVQLRSVLPNQPLTANIDVGKSKIFKCQSFPPCRPKASLKWYEYPSKEISTADLPNNITSDATNSSLTTAVRYLNYTAVKIDNMKRLLCIGTQGSLSVNSSFIHLNIRYPPTEQLSVSVLPEGIVTEGAEINLTCSLSGGNPLATLGWECLEQSLSTVNKSEINTAIVTSTITANSTFNGAKCFCRAEHPVSNYNSTTSTTIHVQYKPTEPLVIKQDPEGGVFAGNVVKLTCSVSGGNPLPTLKWNCTGMETNQSLLGTASNTVQLVLNKSDDNKICACFATHPIEDYRPNKTHILTVYYFPDSKPRTMQTPHNPIDLDQNVTLRCVVDGGNPLPDLTWNCSDKEPLTKLNNRVTAEISFSVKKNDNGKVCACTATQTEGVYREVAVHPILEVHYPPLEPSLKFTPTLPWFNGNKTSIICNTTDLGNPKSNYAWTFNGSSQADIKTNQLIFTYVEKEDNNASVKCSLDNPYTVRKGITVESSWESLNIEYFPEVHTDPIISEIEGKIIKTVCKVYGNPVPDVHWEFPNRSKTESEMGEKILILDDANRRDNGSYKCVGTANSQHGVLIKQQTVDIIVYYPPDINVIYNYTDMGESDVRFRCIASGYPSNYTFVEWQQMYDYVTIRTNTDFPLTGSNGFAMTLTSPTYEDTGNYTCRTNNGIPDRNGVVNQISTIYFEGRGAPSIVEPLPRDNTFTAPKGGNMSLNLFFISIPLETKAFWQKLSINSTLTTISTAGVEERIEQKSIEVQFYGHTVSVEKHGYHAILNMGNFTEEDQGYYTLVMENEIDQSNFTVRAVISGKPDAPALLSVIMTTHRDVTIGWNRGFNGGHNQTFHFHGFELGSSNPDTFTYSKNDNYNEIQEFTIPYLKSLTYYTVQMYSENSIGNSSSIQINITTQKADPIASPASDNQMTIIIPVVAVLAVIIVVVIVVVAKKNGWIHRQGSARKKRENFTTLSSDEDCNGEEGLKDNILYESSNLDISTPTSGAAYAFVGTKRSSGRQNVNETAVYTEVNKVKGSLGKDNKFVANDGDSGNQKRKKKERVLKQQKGINEDVYENMSQKSQTAKSVANGKNKHGLLYADLVFSNNGKERKFIIRGIENRTDYADIDFNLKADPLPDDESDKEDAK